MLRIIGKKVNIATLWTLRLNEFGTMWAMAMSTDLYSRKLTGSLLNCLPHAGMAAMIAVIVELTTREWRQLCITAKLMP
jgi:hypothetical protein